MIFLCNFIRLVELLSSVVSGHYDCRLLYFIIHLAHLFLFPQLRVSLHIIPVITRECVMCVCVVVGQPRKRCQFLARAPFYDHLAFNAFYVLYFLAIAVGASFIDFILVRKARVLRLNRVALRGGYTHTHTYMLVSVCVWAIAIAPVDVVVCCYCL